MTAATSSAQVASLGLGGWVGTIVPTCPQSAEPLRVWVICVAGQGASRKGRFCAARVPHWSEQVWGQQMERGLLLPLGTIGPRPATLLRKTPGYGIPPSLLSSAVFSELGIRGRPQHPGDTFYPSSQSPCVSCSFHLQYPPSLSTRHGRRPAVELVPTAVLRAQHTVGRGGGRESTLCETRS